MFGFGWLTRPRRRPSSRPAFSRPRVPLRLEALEDRYCLSAPQLTLTGVQELASKQALVSGHVTDDVSSTVTLNFGGVVSGTSTVNSNSDYSLVVNAAALGTITVQGTDTLSQTSNTAQITFSSAAPSVTQLSYTWHANRMVTLTGRVIDAVPNGLTVTFTGAASGTTTTDANGNFSVTLTASAVAQVSATVPDQWGQVSSAAAVTLTNDPPVIQNFAGIQGVGNSWTFTGKVIDEVAGGITVSFGGLSSVSGKSVITDGSGNFTLTVTLASGEIGLVLAEAHDMWNVASADASFTVA
jgi:hypothetical protein